jgi:hypothetical protein
VVGDRYWDADLLGNFWATPPEPFESIPLTYERSFGGTDVTNPDPRKRRFHRENLVGTGVYSNADRSLVMGKRLPGIQPPGRRVSSWGDTTETVGFGFVSPQWLPRLSYAGTYDQAWLDYQYPLPPVDFDVRFHQAAPADQQLAAIRAGEEICLKKMHPDGEVRFTLPPMELPMTFLFKDGPDRRFNVAPDTLTLFPGELKFTVVWRCVVPCANKIISLRQVVIGEKPARWFAMQRSPKPHYSSLSEMMLAKER